MTLGFLKKIFGSPLQNKFTLVFVVLAVIPILILGGLTLYLIDLSHRHDVSNLELQLLDQKIEEINKFFVDTLGVLELTVSTDQQYIDSADQEFILEGILKDNRAFEEVSFINLRGRETEKKSRIGMPLTSSGSNILSLERSEAESKGLPYPEVELFDVSRLEKFLVASKGEKYIGEVAFTLSGPVITLAAPVKNRNGEIISVLSAEVNLSSLSRSIETARLGAAGYAILLDRTGAVISHRGLVDVPRGANLSGWQRAEQVLSGAVFDGLAPEDRYESVFGGVPVVGAGKKIDLTGWALLTEWPIKDADALILAVRNQIITFTLFSILAVIILAPFFAMRLIRPIQELEKGAEEIEKGNFEKRVKIQTQDELEELGGAFNKMAEGLKRLQELRNEFVFIAAHELRSPVTAIRGYLSMLFEKARGVPESTPGAQNQQLISPDALPYLNPIKQATERLVVLVNDILEISRQEAGKLKIEVSPHDLRESVRAIVLEAKSLADEKKIALKYEEPATLPQVLADPDRVKEVLMNLISNAIKYNNEGGWVRVYHDFPSSSAGRAGERGFSSSLPIPPRQGEEMAEVVITHVEDNGIGMTEEEKKKIFEKFFRSEDPQVRKISGTGLGMFITKELVERMGGKIWFESEKNKGTRFSFSLPLA